MVYALAVGNFLNCNTKREDSYGFKFSDFEKIIDIKSSFD